MGSFDIPSSSERVATVVRRVADQAHQAMQRGRTVFLARIDTEPTEPTDRTGVLVRATEIIQAVENLGWRLDQMSYLNRADASTSEGYFLFRLPSHPNGTLPDQH